ncbi:amidohydrolase family protein [Cryptosporangium minutisporangium]|uniref:Amidohydrolase n=1 Tax=Cryptosporangium minutisporangium TaxID=113569 RepID=A0ABP6T4E1_9ACTN
MSDSLLVVGGDVVTMAPGREVLTGATIAVVGGRIAALGTAEEMRLRYPGADELDATGCVVTPGMINAHQHTTADPLTRSGIPDDIDSQQAIFEWAVPLHSAHTGGDDEISAMLTAAESLRRGVTTLIEPGTVAHPLRVAAGLKRTGIRARLNGWGWDAEGLPFSAPADEVLARQEELVRALGTTDRVSAWITLLGHDLVSDALFQGAAALAERLDTRMTWHISPGQNDIPGYAQRSGNRPVVHLQKLGVLGPRLLLGHAVWLDDDEVDAILETDTAVASSPGAYLRLGQGFTRAARHVELIRRGGRVALGCDSHNAGDVPDILRAAMLFTGLSLDRGDAEPVHAHEALALATIDGARAIGLGDEIGSIEIGKAADLVVFDTTDPVWTPRGDEALQLVWGMPSHTVRDVLVDGEIVVRDQQLQLVDYDDLRQCAAENSHHLLRRTGITPFRRWPRIAAAELELAPGGPAAPGVTVEHRAAGQTGGSACP